MRILVLTKRQYMNKDLIDDRFGRFREIPLALAQKGHIVDGLCLSYAPKKEDRVKDGSVCWQSINSSHLKVPGLVIFFLKAWELAKHADIIWACSDSIYGIIGYSLAKKCNLPIVFDLYDNFEFFLMARLPLIKQLYRHVVKNCDAVTCVSRPLARLVSAYGRKKPPTVLENAVRKDLFFPMNKQDCRKKIDLPLNARIVGTAGALTRSRGIQTLFDAFDMIKNKHQDLHLAVAGPRDVKVPQNPRIHDLGILPLEKVPVFLNSLDVGIVCNLKNRFGNYCFPQKTREMMACNIPLIASKVGSMHELLADKPRWLYDPGDRHSLAAAIQHRLADCHTGYGVPPSWVELAETVEHTMQELVGRKRH